MADYLESMTSLSSSERQQLRSIGAPTPLALYSAMEASPTAFMRLLGKRRYRKIFDELDRMIPQDEKAKLPCAEYQSYQLGVSLDQTPPPEVERGPLIEERDRVYEQIERIKAAHDRSPETSRALEELEARLEELLKDQSQAA